MRGRKRPADERARAVGIAVVHGGSEAARQTGIPERTVQQWMESEEFAELRARTKDQVAEEWWAGVQQGFRAVIREFESSKAPLQAKATAAAILFDKLAMVRGEATVRSEVTQFRDYDDHERRALTEFFDRRLLDEGTEQVPASAAGGVPQESGS